MLLENFTLYCILYIILDKNVPVQIVKALYGPVLLNHLFDYRFPI